MKKHRTVYHIKIVHEEASGYRVVHKNRRSRREVTSNRSVKWLLTGVGRLLFRGYNSYSETISVEVNMRLTGVVTRRHPCKRIGIYTAKRILAYRYSEFGEKYARSSGFKERE